jgi:hypothetical protein
MPGYRASTNLRLGRGPCRIHLDEFTAAFNFDIALNAAQEALFQSAPQFVVGLRLLKAAA